MPPISLCRNRPAEMESLSRVSGSAVQPVHRANSALVAPAPSYFRLTFITAPE
jgi:hypothetical protein